MCTQEVSKSGTEHLPEASNCGVPFLPDPVDLDGSALGEFSAPQGDPVIHRPAEPLLAADVALRRQHGGVAEQELDLFQLPSRFMAQPSAAPAKIVRGQIVNASSLSVRYSINHTSTNG